MSTLVLSRFFLVSKSSVNWDWMINPDVFSPIAVTVTCTSTTDVATIP